jgi:hypothetical protein
MAQGVSFRRQEVDGMRDEQIGLNASDRKSPATQELQRRWLLAVTRRKVIFNVGVFAILALAVPLGISAQTNCDEGNGPLDSAQPKTLTAAQVIEKMGTAEAAAKNARTRYTYKQDVLMQTLSGTSITGEFHEVTTVSYDSKGKRQEMVTYAAQPTLRGIQLTPSDMDDVRTFMPLMLASDDLAEYNLSYDGQQHVDDLDTYVFHVGPKKEEPGRRYFQGRIWVDGQDFQIVKVCGKSGPEKTRVKKHEHPQLQPTFVTYRQQVDGNWLPAYTKSDDYLQFPGQPMHLKQIVKYTEYKRVTGQ